jgi:hypothetical protein
MTTFEGVNISNSSAVLGRIPFELHRCASYARDQLNRCPGKCHEGVVCRGHGRARLFPDYAHCPAVRRGSRAICRIPVWRNEFPVSGKQFPVKAKQFPFSPATGIFSQTIVITTTFEPDSGLGGAKSRKIPVEPGMRLAGRRAVSTRGGLG